MDLRSSDAAPVVVYLGVTGDDPRVALARLVARITGSSARIVHACVRCGSSAHGQPWALTDMGRVPVSLSRPRDRGPAVVAVCPTRRVGVDIEEMTAAAEVVDVACHPDERPRDAIAATRLWVRKEALLKAHGAGLTVDPRTVCLSPDGEILAGPPGVIVDVDAAPQCTCAVAVAGQSSSVDVRMVSVEDGYWG